MKQLKTKINSEALVVVVGLAVFLTLSFMVPVAAFAAGPATVNTLSASNFAVLSKTGVTDVPASIITGNVGASPISGTAILMTCEEVTGTIYSVNAAGPLPCRVIDSTLLTTAVSDMETAYTDAAGRTLPDATELGSGNIGGMTIAPGLYKWSTGVTIPTNVTLSGGASDVWIFQIAGDLSIASAKSVLLSGGAIASNIFWQVGGPTGATLGTTATVNGTILSAKQVILQTGAVLNGRALAQTQVTLDHSTVNNSVFVPASSAILHVIKSVVNTAAGSAVPSSFTVYVKKAGSNVAGSPQAGAASPGTPYTLSMGTYNVSEGPNGSYALSFSGDCNSSGNVTLAGADKTCTLTNTYITAVTPPATVPSSFGGGGGVHYGCTDPNASNYESFAASNQALCIYGVVSPVKTYVAPTLVTPTTGVPTLPNTGLVPTESVASYAVLLIGIITIVSVLYIGFFQVVKGK